LAELVALDPAQLDNESQRNVRRNAEVMLQRLKTTFGEDTDRLCEFGAFLVQRCFLVAVSTPSQQSAFRVFSVLNSRGLDLLPTDIIKSDVIGSIKQAQARSLHRDLGRAGSRDRARRLRRGLRAHPHDLREGEGAQIAA
jgi:hypothetical protein